MSKRKIHSLLLSTAAVGLAGLLTTTAAYAQDEDQPPAAADQPAEEATDEAADGEQGDKLLTMDQIVVIGTPGGAGVRKQDASFAITTLDALDIEKFSPKSTADLLKTVPGAWVESSGGVSGANIFVRGFPATGDAPFVTISVNGSPIYPPPTLSFLENSTLFRVDETIARVEALRGGPNSVFSNGQIGLTANFVLREGGEETEGLVKYTTSDYGLQRVDAILSGKLADRLYYMVGGYFKSSPGIRDAQFNAEEGAQFTVNLTKEFDAGKINVFARLTDDHGQWYLPFAVNVPGLDIGHHSQLGNFTRFRELQVNANGDTKIFDFAEGRGWDGIVVGGNAEFDLGGGWTLRDNFSYTDGDANTFGFVPDGGAIPVEDLESEIGGPIFTEGGKELGSGDFVQNYGHWVVLKDIDALTNDLSITKTIEAFGEHEITAGYYISRFSSDDFWSLGNFTPVHVTANGDFLESGIDCEDLDDAGSGSSCFLFGLNAGGDGRVRAFYIADSWQIIEDLRIDAAFRHENFESEYVLDTGPGFPDGVRDLVVSLDRDDVAWTVGANYDVFDDVGVFARYSEGVRFPNFDEIREGVLDTQFVEQVEAGVKVSKSYLALFLTGFYNEFQGAKFIDIGGFQSVNTNEAYGLEIDAQGSYGPFNLTVTSTIQNTEIKESSVPGDVGNKAQRQPDWQIRVTPSYDFQLGAVGNMGELSGTLYGTFSAIGDRFSDNANLQSLEGYEKVDLGLLLYLGHLSFQVVGDNVTESEGLTEGDPRSLLAVNARPILGRSVKFSVGYNF